MVTDYYSLLRENKTLVLSSIGRRVRKVIKNNDFKNQCSYQQLEQFTVGTISYRLSGICLPEFIDDVSNNDIVEQLLTRKTPIDDIQLAQLDQQLLNLTIEIDENFAHLTGDDLEIDGQIVRLYDYYQLSVEDKDEWTVIIMVNDGKQIENMISVTNIM